MYNRVVLIGRLGKEAEVNFTKSGKAVLNLVVGTERRYYSKREEKWKSETEWHKVKMRRKGVENLAERLKKGDLVMVEGELRYDVFEGRNKEMVKVAFVRAEEVKILGKTESNRKEKEEKNQDGEEQERKEEVVAEGASEEELEEDLPF